jgi:16S rRNA G966 N2-methylase RsmD
MSRIRTRTVPEPATALGGDREMPRDIQVCLAERACSKSDLARIFLRKLKVRMFGVRHEIEPAAIYGLVVFDRRDLDGGGRGFGQDYIRVLSEIGIEGCGRLFEFCSGPGYIGYSLLSRGFCKHLVLADINPVALQAARKTAEFNRVEQFVTIYESDGLSRIPSTERWDIVIGNPPHFPAWSGRSRLVFEDRGWSLHRAFYSSVKSFLNPGAAVLLQENSMGSSPEVFEPMINDGGGRLVDTMPGPDFGDACKIYYILSRWD